MAKRKAGVNTIIYELDNDDIEISSDDEAKEPKKGRLEDKQSEKVCENKNINDVNSVEVISLDSSEEIVPENEPSKHINNGGKSSSETNDVVGKSFKLNSQDQDSDISIHKSENNIHTTVLDDNIVIDSPANSDLGVVGCENKTPLVSVHFKDNRLARAYKKTIKEFFIKLLKTQIDEINEDLTDSDYDLDIWPEDLEEENSNGTTEIDDSLFFVDTKPCDDTHIDIPKYRQNSMLISNASEKEDNPPSVARRRQTCFNCDGEHQLRDCPLPRDNQRISEKRKHMAKVGRYHVEDDQKYGHLVPGRISATLRSALGLKRYELPLYIYRMRLLGYPPGWLEEARISHSGITMFDSTGNAIQDPEEEEGELCEPGSKDKFDIKKILDFPGFNVPASSRYVEESHLYGLPPISEQDSKMLMLQTLAPNAVKAYKRKKLLFFPSANNNSLQEQAEMELDSGDEAAEFPSIPPLPDDEPPPVPPPPPPLPPLPPPETEETYKSDKISPETEKDNVRDTNKVKVLKSSPKVDTESKEAEVKQSSEADIDKSSIKNKNLSIEQIDLCSDEGQADDGTLEAFITIDEDNDSASQLSSGRNSPTLDDLEQKKRLLLNALKSSNIETDTSVNLDSPGINKNDEITDVEIEEFLESAVEKLEKKRQEDIKAQLGIPDIQENNAKPVEITKTSVPNGECDVAEKDSGVGSITTNNSDVVSEDQLSVHSVESSHATDDDGTGENTDNKVSSPSSVTQTHTDNKTGHVKTTQYGTPVLNVASDYLKLPTEDKFAKDICDVINFENLPNSTGKFKQISSLLKKVKSVVDRIQES